MTPTLADRLSRAVVGCYPRRWKQRYAAELLDVLDQHRAGPRTVLSLAGGALSTHLDPDYRMQMPRLSREARQAVVIIAAMIVVPARASVILAVVPRAIRESRWQPSSSDSVAAIAFSRDQRIVVSATGGPPWEATSTLWDVTGQARPRRLSVFEGGSPATISPDGATVAVNAFGGRAQAALWDVTRPRHPARLAVPPACPARWGEAFSPDGRILAAASTTGLVLWDVADPARPRLLRSLAAAPLRLDNPGPPVPFGVTQGDLVFSPDGRMLASVSRPRPGHRVGRGPPDPGHPHRHHRQPGSYFAALAFSPRGNLLAGVTYHGSVLVFRIGRPRPPGPRQHPPRHPGQRAVPRRGNNRRPLQWRLRLCRRLRGGLHPGRARPDGRDQPPRGVSQRGRIPRTRSSPGRWPARVPSATSPPSSATSTTPSRPWPRAPASWPTAPSQAARSTCRTPPDPPRPAAPAGT